MLKNASKNIRKKLKKIINKKRSLRNHISSANENTKTTKNIENKKEGKKIYF